MINSIGYGSEVPAPQIRRKTKPNMSKAEKQQFYSQKIQKDGTKIEDIPSEFRTIEVYVLALSNVKNLAEKRHVVKLMMQDAKEYREAGMAEKAVVLESLKGLVFGKVTMQENSENEVSTPMRCIAPIEVVSKTEQSSEKYFQEYR